jgi:hypothetical protein
MADSQDTEWKAQMSDLYCVETIHNVHPPKDIQPRISPEIKQFIEDQGDVGLLCKSSAKLTNLGSLWMSCLTFQLYSRHKSPTLSHSPTISSRACFGRVSDII